MRPTAATVAKPDIEEASHPLRVGIFLDSFAQPRWVAEMLRQVITSPFARVVLVVHAADLRSSLPPASGLPSGRAGQGSSRGLLASLLLYTLYRNLDHRLFGGDPDPLERVELRTLLAEVPVLQSGSGLGQGGGVTESALRSRLRAERLDVAIRLGAGGRWEGMADLPKYGTWFYHLGDEQRYPGGPSGLWEVWEGDPVTGSVLLSTRGRGGGERVLYRSWSATHPLSLSRSRERFCWKSSTFVRRKLRDLHALGVQSLGSANDISDRRPSDAVSRAPTNLDMLRLFGRLARRHLSNVRKELGKRRQWFLAYKMSGMPAPGVPARALHDVRPLLPPRDRFWADPFPVHQGGRYFIFFEEFVWGSGKGHIAVVEVDEQGRPSDPVTVLERDYHLSYPFLFAWEDGWFMIPESCANRTVEAYRATRFPYEWALEKVLLRDIEAVDATLERIDDRWWMFANVPTEGLDNYEDELHLFHASSPFGPWTPHRRNPVKSDVRGARPAGRLFRWKGSVYRPAQDCAVRYGHAVTIHRVDVLSERDFRETEVAKVRPTWHPGLIATHTLNAAHGLTVIDGQRRVLKAWGT